MTICLHRYRKRWTRQRTAFRCTEAQRFDDESHSSSLLERDRQYQTQLLFSASLATSRHRSMQIAWRFHGTFPESAGIQKQNRSKEINNQMSSSDAEVTGCVHASALTLGARAASGELDVPSSKQHRPNISYLVKAKHLTPCESQTSHTL